MSFIYSQINWDEAYSKLLRNYNNYVSQPEAYPYLNSSIKMQEAENLIEMYRNGNRSKKLYKKMIQYK